MKTIHSRSWTITIKAPKRLLKDEEVRIRSSRVGGWGGFRKHAQVVLVEDDFVRVARFSGEVALYPKAIAVERGRVTVEGIIAHWPFGLVTRDGIRIIPPLFSRRES